MQMILGDPCERVFDPHRVCGAQAENLRLIRVEEDTHAMPVAVPSQLLCSPRKDKVRVVAACQGVGDWSGV